jgi:hypothetical protein
MIREFWHDLGISRSISLAGEAAAYSIIGLARSLRVGQN